MSIKPSAASPIFRPVRSPITRLMGGGIVGPSLPQSASIVFNMKADSLALADGATVSTWTDSSANALAFTGTGTFKTAQLGGKPCVRFSGSAGQVMTAPVTGAGANLMAAMTQASPGDACTVMIVAKSAGANGTGTIFGSHAGGASCFYVIDGAAATSTIGRYTGNVNFCAPNVNASNMFVMADTSQNGAYFAGSGTGFERVYINGSCFRSNTVVAPPPNQTTFSIGGASAGNVRAAVDVFDIVVWNRFLTPLEVFQATSYFYDKYSQTKPWVAVSNLTVFDGDSITAGVAATNTAGTYPYKSAVSLGLTYGQWTNLGVGGITMANMSAKLSEWSGIGAALGKGMRVAAFEYYNQKGSGAAYIQTQNNAYATSVRALSNTKLALGTSTSHGADTTGTPDATRAAVNSYYDINFATYCDAYVPIHSSATHIGPTNSTVANPTYFSGDLVHLTDLGYTELESVFTPALQAIP